VRGHSGHSLLLAVEGDVRVDHSIDVAVHGVIPVKSVYEVSEHNRNHLGARSPQKDAISLEEQFGVVWFTAKTTPLE
jgi:hypothetical protein